MKHALVTGGSRGIGRAVCIKLARMGYQVIINYVSHPEEAQKTLELVREAGQDGELLPFDVSRHEEVCAAIDDALSGREMLSAEDAKTYFLAYMNYGAYERTRAYEEQYLSDLEKSDRDIVRTRSGLTYKVEELGDMNRAVTSNRDTVAIRYTIESIDCGQVYSSYERGDTLRAAVNRLIDGLGEGVQLVGEGGKLIMWIPSALGYGAMGNEELGVKPNQMLRYEVEVVEVKRRR